MPSNNSDKTGSIIGEERGGQNMNPMIRVLIRIVINIKQIRRG